MALLSRVKLLNNLQRTKIPRIKYSTKPTEESTSGNYKRMTFPESAAAYFGELPILGWAIYNSDRYMSYLMTSFLVTLPLFLWADRKRYTLENKAAWAAHLIEEDEEMYYRKMDNMGKPILF